MPENYRLVEINQDVAFDGCYLFNTYRYFQIHKTNSAFYFGLRNAASDSIAGVCHFTEIEDGKFTSPLRGTFAGPQLLPGNFNELQLFLALLEEMLKQKGASQITFTSAPTQYSPLFSQELEKATLQCNYAVVKNEPAYIMEVDEKEFSGKINRNHKRHLKKCIASGFVFEQVFTKNEMQEVYNVIVANRRHKGYDISMTWEQIKEMAILFPDSLYFFRASFGNKIAASAICIRINERVLYVFYWGDIPGSEAYSPVTFIANGIYKFAQHKKFKLLDIGSASLHGQSIPGLINFKESLGFIASDKFTYAKNL